MTGTNIYTLTTLENYLSEHPFTKDDIFEVSVNLSSRGTPIGIVSKNCEHHNMSYISHSTNNIPWNKAFPERNRTNVCILSIVRKTQQGSHHKTPQR